MIGRTISHYTVLEKLGAGGMGEIYKAQDTRLNRFVAMKVLSTANAGDMERRRRFVQEAQAASALNHPNIITIHDVVSTEGLELMVMEFVSGVTLDDLIPKHGLNVQKTLDVSVQIADALQAAHAAGIVHRDLKPGNVMVTGTGLVKILDFGIAKLTGPAPSTPNTDETLPIDSPMTVEGAILGTVCYMSPEQAQAKTVDPRSDIFSFGLLLYEMLTGQKAFSGDSALSTLSSILRDEPKPIHEMVNGVPVELEEIVHRAMRKDPAERWQSMQDMRAPMMVLKQKADSGVLQTQLGVAAVVAPGKMPGLVPMLAAATVVVVLAGALGGVWWIKHRKPHAPPPPPVATVPALIPAPPPDASAATPADGSTPAPADTAAPVDAAMTNQSVIDMVEAKVPSVTIGTQIRSSKTNFDLSTNGIIQLSKAGVSPSIIEVMRNPRASAPVAAAAPPRTTPVPVTAPTPAPVETAPPVPVAAPTVTPPTPAQPTPPPPEPAAPATVHAISVPAGMPFTIGLTQDVPAKLTAGQKISFTVKKDVKIGGMVVIPQGTGLLGEIVDPGDGKKLLIVKNKATFKLTSVDIGGGATITIRATPARTEKVERPIEQGGKSKDVLAAAGTEYMAYIDKDQSVTIKQ